MEPTDATSIAQLVVDGGFSVVTAYLVWNIIQLIRQLIAELRIRDNEERESLLQIIEQQSKILEEVLRQSKRN